MEYLLDKISDNEANQKDILNNYINKLKKLISEVKLDYKENPEKIKKVSDTSLHCGKYNELHIFIKNGIYGYYVSYEKDKKLSLKEFKGFNIKRKIDSHENIEKKEYEELIKFIENNKNTESKILVKINENCSIRNGKYGEYIYYKTKKMKKPNFYSYNDNKDDMNDVRKQWIKENNILLIKDYIIKKYKINI